MYARVTIPLEQQAGTLYLFQGSATPDYTSCITMTDKFITVFISLCQCEECEDTQYYAFMYGSSLHVADNFIQTVLLECINKSTSILYHTMTVLLEYIDCSLQFSINA